MIQAHYKYSAPANNKERYQTTQVSKLGDSTNTPKDQNVWCEVAELMQVVMMLAMVGHQAARPVRQVLADRGRRCYYGHSCPAGRICCCISALERVHHTVAVGIYAPHLGRQGHGYRSSEQG